MSNFSVKQALLGAIVLASGAVFTADAADAQMRQREKTFATENGRSATASRSISREDGSRQTTTSVQTANGRGATRTINQGYSAETGLYSDRSFTTNSGAAASRNSSTQCIDGVCSNTTSTTGFNGRTVEHAKSAYEDEAGSLITTNSVTGPEGQSAARSVITTNDGQKTTTLTTPDGDTRSRTHEVVID